MSYLTTGLDILRHTLERGGESPTLTTGFFYDRTKKHVMRALADICKSAPFPWAVSRGVLSIPAVLGPTVSGISGTTWTLSASIATSQATNKILLNADGAIYRISSHTAGTATITADAAYIGASTSGAGTIFQDEYALASDCMMPWLAWYRNEPTRILDIVTGSTAIGRTPTNSQSGNSSLGVIRQPSGIMTVRITPYLANASIIEYDYAVRPTVLTFDGVAGTDTPVVPIEDRVVIADRALYYLLLDKMDDRADVAMMGSMNKLREMAQQATGADLEIPMSKPTGMARE